MDVLIPAAADYGFPDNVVVTMTWLQGGRLVFLAA